MNIESANLSSIASSNSMVDNNVSTPPIDGSGISESFSGALAAQLELLNDIKAEDSSSLQTSDQAVLQDVNGLQTVAGLPVDTQNVAALLGNDLPPSYKTKDEVDHEAALAAVTDTLKYISAGTAAREKAVEAEQNMENVIAIAVPTEQKIDEKTVPIEQALAPVTEQVSEDVPVQMDLERSSEQPNDEPDKNQDEAQVQITTVSDSDKHGAEELLVTAVYSPITPIEQRKSVTNSSPSNAIREDGLLAFIKPSAEHAKPNQMTKLSSDVLQSKAVPRQQDQGKQPFNIKYFENAGQSEQAERAEQMLNDSEKTLPLRIGTEIIQPNKPGLENKVEIPAMTKPLSHPEWNKDMGERIIWMSSRAIPSAEIRLNPQHLGPISVRVDVTDDKATVVFTAQHAAVRETLEASIPKLREMMSSQQLNLVEVNVSQGSASDQGRSQSQSFAQTSGRGQGVLDGAIEGVDDIEQEIESGRAEVSKGLLSLYA